MTPSTNPATARDVMIQAHIDTRFTEPAEGHHEWVFKVAGEAIDAELAALTAAGFVIVRREDAAERITLALDELHRAGMIDSPDDATEHVVESLVSALLAADGGNDDQ